MNQLQAVALSEGLRCKKRLWREGGREQLKSFPLAPWASRRRRDLLGVAGPIESNDCRVDTNSQAGSGEMSWGATVADASPG